MWERVYPKKFGSPITKKGTLAMWDSRRSDDVRDAQLIHSDCSVTTMVIRMKKEDVEGIS